MLGVLVLVVTLDGRRASGNAAPAIPASALVACRRALDRWVAAPYKTRRNRPYHSRIEWTLEADRVSFGVYDTSDPPDSPLWFWRAGLRLEAGNATAGWLLIRHPDGDHEPIEWRRSSAHAVAYISAQTDDLKWSGADRLQLVPAAKRALDTCLASIEHAATLGR